MPSLSKRLRNLPPGRVTVTAQLADAPGAAPPSPALQVDHVGGWFAALDDRRLPVTWSVVTGENDWLLGREVLGSPVAHELAFRSPALDLDRQLQSLARQAEKAQRIELPLRTFVASGDGVHPALLARLGVSALVVPCPAPSPNRTGALRAVSWNVWEAPITDRILASADPTEWRRLIERLEETKRHELRMHLLVNIDSASETQLPFFDRLAEWNYRGLVVVETIAAAAAQATRQAGGAAA